MRLWWTAIALAACGESKAPVAPIVVAEAPAPATASAASAQPVERAPAAPAASALPPEETTTNDGEPATGNVWGDSIGAAFEVPATNDGGAGLGRIGKGTTPTLRQGVVTVNGKLPPEVIQRIVRASFGRYRLCYENGLRTNAKLRGRVTVKFTVDRAGAVSKLVDGGSDLPDKNVIACVAKGFASLSFPQPDSGEVHVVYPIVFSPGD